MIFIMLCSVELSVECFPPTKIKVRWENVIQHLKKDKPDADPWNGLHRIVKTTVILDTFKRNGLYITEALLKIRLPN